MRLARDCAVASRRMFHSRAFTLSVYQKYWPFAHFALLSVFEINESVSRVHFTFPSQLDVLAFRKDDLQMERERKIIDSIHYLWNQG